MTPTVYAKHQKRIARLIVTAAPIGQVVGQSGAAIYTSN
jgi:hypothetical protein